MDNTPMKNFNESVVLRISDLCIEKSEPTLDESSDDIRNIVNQRVFVDFFQNGLYTVRRKNGSYKFVNYSLLNKEFIFNKNTNFNLHLWLKFNCLLQYMIANSLSERLGHKTNYRGFYNNGEILPFNGDEETSYSIALCRFFSQHYFYSESIMTNAIIEFNRKVLHDVCNIVNSVVENVRSSFKASNIIETRGRNRQMTIDRYGSFVWVRTTNDSLWDCIKGLYDHNSKIISLMTGNNTYPIEMESLTATHFALFNTVFKYFNDNKSLYYNTNPNTVNSKIGKILGVSNSNETFDELIKKKVNELKRNDQEDYKSTTLSNLSSSISSGFYKAGSAVKSAIPTSLSFYKSDGTKETRDVKNITDPYASALSMIYKWLTDEDVSQIEDISEIVKLIEVKDRKALTYGYDYEKQAYFAYLGGYHGAYLKNKLENKIEDKLDVQDGVMLTFKRCSSYSHALSLCVSSGLPTMFMEEGQNFTLIPVESSFAGHLMNVTDMYDFVDLYNDVNLKSDKENTSYTTMGELAPALRQFFTKEQNKIIRLCNSAVLLRSNSNNTSVENDVKLEVSVFDYVFLFDVTNPEYKPGPRKLEYKEGDIESIKVVDKFDFVNDAPPFLDLLDNGTSSWYKRHNDILSNAMELSMLWWLQNNIPGLYLKEVNSNITSDALKSLLFEDVNTNKYSIISSNSDRIPDKSIYSNITRYLRGESVGDSCYYGLFTPDRMLPLFDLLKM